MFVDFNKITKLMMNAKIHKPLSGTLSGHAAGEPFDKHVYQSIKSLYPNNTFRQFEYLNYLYSKNPEAVTFESRVNLLDSSSISHLISRGKKATIDWSLSNQFIEKQNDTADILVTDGRRFEIIDIKTRNLGLDSQPPNIISAYKLAQLMAIILDEKVFDVLTIKYFSIDWDLDGDYLICKNTHYADLFKVDPKTLYINWAAAMQIQFHVSNLQQNYYGTIEQWAQEYLNHFVQQAHQRVETMHKKFILPFHKYIK